MASMKKPATSSAAKVRMADAKMTKAANAKAPRNPRGQQGYGMNTSKGSVRVEKQLVGIDEDSRGGFPGTSVFVKANSKKSRDSLMKTTLKSKSAQVPSRKAREVNMKQNDKSYTGYGEYSKPSKPVAKNKRTKK
jgi:hypothetical protein